MNTPRKSSASEELERIEDSLVESFLMMSGKELREEIVAAGSDPDALVAGIDSAFASARAASASARLERARAELAAWRGKGSVSALEREAARTRLDRLQSGSGDSDGKFMMAARKGQGLSDQDIKGLVEDMAELERLERDNGEE